MDTVKRVWSKDLGNTAAAIPQSWILTDEDGSMWIDPRKAGDSPVVKLYRELMLVGYARGWMP